MKDLLRRMLGMTMSLLLRARSQPYPLSAGALLVVAPHADDETLGCGGLLALRSARGDAIQVVFISDSAGSAEDRPQPGLAARRRAEALAALEVLGVPASQAHFLDAPDGKLNRLTAPEADRVDIDLASLLQRLKPGEIFVPYLGGGSSEHDATVQLARTALARSGVPARVWEYPVWAWWDARRLVRQLSRPQENFCLELGPMRARKRQALACHRSQLEIAAPAGGTRAASGPRGALHRNPGIFFHRPS